MQHPIKSLTPGQVARESGVRLATIRFYEPRRPTTECPILEALEKKAQS